MEKVNLGKRKFRAGFFSIIGLLILVPVSSQLAAADWSTGVSLSPVMAPGTPNAFAGDPAGNQLQVTRKAVTGGYIVQAAQRSADGSWSALTDISALLPSALGLTAGISADGNAAAA